MPISEIGVEWQVEVPSIRGEIRELRAALERSDYSIEPDPHQAGAYLLAHASFADMAAAEVNENAEQLAQRLRALEQNTHEPLGLDIGAVRLPDGKGGYSSHSFPVVGEVLLASDTVTATVQYAAGITQAGRLREAERAAAEATTRRRVARAAAALLYPTVIDVVALMAKPDATYTELGHIVDLVANELPSRKLTPLGADLDADAKRFKNTINEHPGIVGIKRRHAPPPQNPKPAADMMPLKDVRPFALRVGALWLRSVGYEP